MPELQRTHLAGTLLLLKAAGIDSVMTYPWAAPPPAEAVVRALEQLYALGAINEDAKCAPHAARCLPGLEWPLVLRAGRQSRCGALHVCSLRDMHIGTRMHVYVIAMCLRSRHCQARYTCKRPDDQVSHENAV